MGGEVRPVGLSLNAFSHSPTQITTSLKSWTVLRRYKEFDALNQSILEVRGDERRGEERLRATSCALKSLLTQLYSTPLFALSSQNLGDANDVSLPKFPAKKMFPMSSTDKSVVEQRRAQVRFLEAAPAPPSSPPYPPNTRLTTKHNDPIVPRVHARPAVQPVHLQPAHDPHHEGPRRIPRPRRDARHAGEVLPSRVQGPAGEEGTRNGVLSTSKAGAFEPNVAAACFAAVYVSNASLARRSSPMRTASCSSLGSSWSSWRWGRRG